jgi:hypothetical protein
MEDDIEDLTLLDPAALAGRLEELKKEGRIQDYTITDKGVNVVLLPSISSASLTLSYAHIDNEITVNGVTRKQG